MAEQSETLSQLLSTRWLALDSWLAGSRYLACWLEIDGWLAQDSWLDGLR